MLGKPVADFTAAATGGDFQLSAHRGRPVVLYFYPKDNTPGCTTESQQFRDLYPRSCNSIASSRAFRATA